MTRGSFKQRFNGNRNKESDEEDTDYLQTFFKFLDLQLDQSYFVTS